jgi:hypothetical protein
VLVKVSLKQITNKEIYTTLPFYQQGKHKIVTVFNGNRWQQDIKAASL